MKSLAATILDQRSDTEQFFLEALQEVRNFVVFIVAVVEVAVVISQFRNIKWWCCCNAGNFSEVL